MDGLAQMRLSVDCSTKDNFSASSVADEKLNSDINATDNCIGLRVIPDDAAIDGNALGLTFAIAEHITATDAPTFGSLGEIGRAHV